MILNGSQRGGAKQLAQHLLRTDDNEHVQVHEVRGFLTDDVIEAFKEVQAISTGTECTQPFFSVSLNPPETEVVSISAFDAAIDQIEARQGLAGYPRVIVFHEKEGRRHAHAVWSRINTQTMTASNLPHFKIKLREISRGLFFEHGWRIPHGLINSAARDPRNLTLAEWQQSKRIGISARDIKQMVQECWAASDSGTAFAHALSERGFTLARGDRRDFVLVSCEGEVLGLRSQLAKRTKDLKAKLGDPQALPGVAEAKQAIASDMTQTIRRQMQEAAADLSKSRALLEQRREKMVKAHREARAALAQQQEARQNHEAQQRTAGLKSGISGLWQFLTGMRARIKRQNEIEAMQAFQRDRAEREALTHAQLQKRQGLQLLITAERRRFAQTVLQLRAERSTVNAFSRAAVREEQIGSDHQPVLPTPTHKAKRTRRPRRTSRPPRGKRSGPRLEM